MNHPALLQEYYRESLYPFALIHRLMTLNRKNQSGEARTVALQYPGDENVFVTYDYRRETSQAFQNRLVHAGQRPPESVHLGLFREHFGHKLVKGVKELVFDLDITDFKRYCSCGTSKQLCSVCWPQMQGASLILEHLLQHTLGYKKENRLWIFSGGKGVHCFINARLAMCLGDKEREQLHRRLFIAEGDDSRMAAFVNLVCAKYPEFVKEVEHFFMTHLLKGANLFALPAFQVREDEPDLVESFELACLRHLRIHHGPLAQLVKGSWSSIDSSFKKVDEDCLKRRCVEHNISVKKWKALQELEQLRQEAAYRPSLFLMFRLLYPMIDKGPFKIGHQIKLPFSVHHRTKNIALPLSHESLMQMNLSGDALSVQKLCQLKRTRQPLPANYIKGLELLEQWIEVY